MLWTLVFACFAYFGGDVAVQVAPPPLAARIAAWQNRVTLQASCRLAFFSSHVDSVTTEIG